MNRITLLLAASLALSAASAMAQLSPGGANRIGSQPLVQSPNSHPDKDTTKSKRKVDDTYAQGRAILAGKARGQEPVQVCVKIGDQLLAMLDARSHELRAFNSRAELGNAMHDCSTSGQPQLREVLDEQDVAAVVYFLNKRLDLDLKEDDD